MIQLLVKKTEASCNFCTRREPALFTISSSDPGRTLVIHVCKFCAEHLALAFNSIHWQVQV